MKPCALWLLALVPCAAPAPTEPGPPMALELHVRAPLRTGVFEWRMRMGHVAGAATPYDVGFCADGEADACAGIHVRLRLLVARAAVAAG